MTGHDRDDCDERIATLTGTVKALEERILDQLAQLNERLDRVEARATEDDRAS